MANCRFCSASLEHVVVDLGVSPLANSYIDSTGYMAMEPFYPLVVYLCDQCGLVQLEAFTRPEDIFCQYDYFSSYSDSWLKHAKDYVSMMMLEYGLDQSSQVVEIASNDGYLLRYFVERGIKVLGVEPAVNVARVARERGVPTETVFFGLETAYDLCERGYQADLILANNVLAHVPDINDFLAGLAALIKPSGIITVEFPHLLNLVKDIQFDTIYHEHFSYLSFTTTKSIFTAHGLRIFDVKTLSTHGGSLRIFACPAAADRQEKKSVAELLAKEAAVGLGKPEAYAHFAEAVLTVKNDLVGFLLEANRKGKRVLGYGAAAKGNTLLNFAGIRPDLLPMVADRSAAKQGKFLPGSRIPIITPERLIAERPDYVLILPWNLQHEIADQLAPCLDGDTQFVTAIPKLRVWK